MRFLIKTARFSDAQIMGILKQAEGGTPVSELCREHGMSSASFFKWRSNFGGRDASLISEMKDMAEQNGRLIFRPVTTRDPSITSAAVAKMNKEVCNQMNVLGEMFPNYSQLKPTTINWASYFQWGDEAGLQLGQVLLSDEIAAQKLGQTIFFERGRILRDDLSALAAATGDEVTLAIIDAIKLAISQPFTHRLCKVGELAQAYDWILWSISRNHVIADGRV